MANQTYRLKNTDSITPELFHFNKKKLIKISEIIAKPNSDFTSEITLAQFYNFEKINWEIKNIGGLSFIKLLGFQEYQKHPIISLVEKINEEEIILKVILDNKVKTFEFEKINSPNINKGELIGTWGDDGLKLEILDDEKFKFNKNNKTYSGTWTIDNSNKLLTLKGAHDFLVFATLNKKRNAVMMEDKKNTMTSLLRKY